MPLCHMQEPTNIDCCWLQWPARQQVIAHMDLIVEQKQTYELQGKEHFGTGSSHLEQKDTNREAWKSQENQSQATFKYHSRKQQLCIRYHENVIN